VPVGFVSDGYSLPLLRTFLTFGGLSLAPAVIHDFEYWMQVKRTMADSNLFFHMLETGDPCSSAIITYALVRLCGGDAYRRNGKYMLPRVAYTRENAEAIVKDFYE